MRFKRFWRVSSEWIMDANCTLFAFALSTCGYESMSAKHRRTFAALFEDPVRVNILWNDIVTLMKSLGADVTERAGSRVAFTLDGRTIVLHRPHPGKEVRPYAVEDLRDFLVEAGVTP